MNETLAQGFVIKSPGSTAAGITITGPLNSNIRTLADLINLLVAFLIPLAGLILFFIIIWGGYDVLMSEGNAEKVQAGRQKITAGIVGFVLLMSSYFIARLLAYIFGVGEGVL